MITDDQIKLMIGSLLHDIGKVVYRSGDGRNHSQSGYEYLKNEAHISDDEILNCVRYHHGMYLKNASLAEDDKAYVVTMQTMWQHFRIAERRKQEKADLIKRCR